MFPVSSIAGRNPEGKGVCVPRLLLLRLGSRRCVWLSARVLLWVALEYCGEITGFATAVIHSNESDNLCRREGPNPAYLIFHE